MEKRVFPGVGPYIELTDVPPLLRVKVLEDVVLQDASHLIGEAYRQPEHAAAILEGAADRAKVIIARAIAVERAMNEAREFLIPAEPEEPEAPTPAGADVDDEEESHAETRRKRSKPG